MQVGKPGAYSFVDIPLDDPRVRSWLDDMCDHYDNSWALYQKLLGEGMAKEQARIVLPLALYSKMIWSCNPRSLMHFIGLRADEQAMQEIRDLAMLAQQYFARVMPVTHDAFVENGRVAP
jgi:thymidylate synthase (FAD)